MRSPSTASDGTESGGGFGREGTFFLSRIALTFATSVVESDNRRTSRVAAFIVAIFFFEVDNREEAERSPEVVVVQNRNK